MVLEIEKILKLKQEELLDYCYIDLLKKGYKKIKYTKDYVYAEGDIPILLVAHTDIVHSNPPKLIVKDLAKMIMWSPTGIGGDDRCGVYAILKICEAFKPYVLFTTGEERGGLGVKKFVKEVEKPNVKFIIEIDRRGNNQVVYYECGNEDFQKYIQSFGFEKQHGSYSDVSTLSTEYDIAGCNVSAGYYNEHTTTEHIYLEHLDNTITKVMAILEDENNIYYDCKKVEYTTKFPKTRYYYDDLYDDLYDDYYLKKNKKEDVDIKELDEDAMLWEMEEDYYVLNKKEWKKKYKTNKPKDIVDLYMEDKGNGNNI